MAQFDVNINFKNVTQGEDKIIHIAINDPGGMPEGYKKLDVVYDDLSAGDKAKYDDFVNMMQTLANA